MPDTVPFESSADRLAKAIEDEVKTLRAQDPLELPERGAPIVKHYVAKIEGKYDVRRAKTDTDNAVDLLYIAYNTTPQEEGDIRVKISKIMDRLLRAQRTSQLVMAEAMGAADDVITFLDIALPGWLDAKEDGGVDSVKAFLTQDLLQTATDIKAKATEIRGKLASIATSYDDIITDTAAATHSSEKALASRLADQKAILAEINEAEADRDQVESLVKDLQDEVQKFEAKARAYEQRATTAEERAFVLQIIKIGAQVVAAALPPIAMALGAGATGGASVIAASTMKSITQAGKPEERPAPDSTSEVLKTKSEIAAKKKDLVLAEKKVTESKSKVAGLRKDLTTAQEAAGKPVEAGSAKETVAQPEDNEEVKGVKERLKDAKQTLSEDESKVVGLVGALSGLQASLTALAQGLGELSQDQKDEAAGLREIQMKMLDKAEAYERERREQAAKLVKINALLKGKLSQEETIKLAVQSLNLSISALKRTKEIIEEIASFFNSFVQFMARVAEEARIEVTVVEGLVNRGSIGKSSLERLLRSTDEFFIRQAGEWRAVGVVSEAFNNSFADGFTKLNGLAGQYITGDKLTAYLAEAAALLTKISADRQAAANARLLDLGEYRKMLRDDAAGSDPAAA